MHWGIFAISAAHLYQNYLEEPDVFFSYKKMSQNVWATIMQFGPVTLIYYWTKKNFSALISGTVYHGDQFYWCLGE
jgi:hypothetical protein